jgi:hypothetical protein
MKNLACDRVIPATENYMVGIKIVPRKVGNIKKLGFSTNNKREKTSIKLPRGSDMLLQCRFIMGQNIYYGTNKSRVINRARDLG